MTAQRNNSQAYPRWTVRLVAMLFTLHCSLFISEAPAQTVNLGNISQISQSDPLIITGTIGTQNTYYHSSIGSGYSSPLSNVFYANLNISLYGISMPFSLYYSNDNTSFNHPHFRFRLNPRYKNWTGYFGQSSMSYSEYVMGMSFNGIGLEYNDGRRLRFGCFYGILRNAINDDPTEPFARAPQYKRLGWGLKVGYGSRENFLDLYFLRAYDRLKSLDEQWQRSVAPQENIVVGLKGGVMPVKHLSLNVNAAASLFSTDTRAQEVSTGSGLDGTLKASDRWGAIFTTRYSSLARFAGDVSANLALPGFSASAYYRMIQPDYTSLGTYYMTNNYQSLGLTLSTTLFRNLSLTGNFSGQEDNLTNKQLYTTRGLVYAVMASTRFGDLNLSLGYNGYTQKQYDGTAQVNDTTRIDRRTQSITFTPSYSIDGDALTHTFAVSASYTENKDLNRLSRLSSAGGAGSADITSKAVGLSYNLGVKAWATDFTTSLNHQVSKGMNNRYTSDIASLTTSRSFLSDEALTVAITASLIYNEIEHQSKSLSIGGDLQMGYNIKKVHLFSLSAGINKYGDVNPTKTRSTLDATDISASLNYTYTFSLLEVKRKK